MIRPIPRPIPIDRRIAALAVLILCLVPLSLACRKADAPAAQTPATAVEEIMQTSESGPVKATVTLSPKQPKLGDSLTLTLTVTAQARVQVEMPPFGEALGRFAITSFTPRNDNLPDGSTRLSQRYVLEAPMSGRQRIPALRVEFTDQRPGAQAPSSADGGAADRGDATREILTDEISVDIASVLGDGKDSELRGLRDPLPEGPGPGQIAGYLAAPAAALLAFLGFIWLQRRRRRAALEKRISAYDHACQRLADLQRRGWPAKQEADAWYVELSDIVRRYIEDRYGVRAPELTTEEFLREAHQQIRLQPPQRERLEAFLSTCDRVKFAGYLPETAESRQAYLEAEQFLEETRLQATGAAAASGGGAA